MNTLFGGALVVACAVALVSTPAAAQPSAQAITGPVLYCFVSPNDQPPVGNFGRCTSFYPASSYTAAFEIRNLPTGSYSYVWTTEMGLVLPCTASRCSQQYRGGMAISDIVNVTYTNLATGEAKTLSRSVAINGPF
ncbi:hypothetical protein [Lysobacter sp. CA196]|uniref:hypothetical protein n=1 Tax=Lysobacter sp. CA196 TaxID=3455606 RepID=UPI003F8D3923